MIIHKAALAAIVFERPVGAWCCQLATSQKVPTRPIGVESAGMALWMNYWYPLYAFLRRNGYSPRTRFTGPDTGLFCHTDRKGLFESDRPGARPLSLVMMDVDQEVRGRAGTLPNRLRNEGEAEKSFGWNSKKENGYQREPVDGWTAEKLFDRRWTWLSSG